ncbi:MAG: prepilin peptidase, partial [Candidatus Omnitrophica bacterium]|nr:prepilin peptidase [Candidatus Omnitrophota bacterium]
MIPYLIIFISGALIGSFLNVCIYRVPIGKSIVTPRSFCPFCENRIRWYDNLPLVSFLMLRGKCRDCGRPIPLRYPVVELLNALVWTFLYYSFGYGTRFFVYAAFSSALLVVAAVDLEHQEIPDIISIPGIFLGLFLMTFLRLDGSRTAVISFWNSFLGIVAGGGVMFLMGIAGEFIFKKEALGGGDVKLMAMIGAFLGWKLALLTFFAAPVLGAGVGLFMKLRFGEEVIPYGPFISLAALLSLLYGTDILRYI